MKALLTFVLMLVALPASAAVNISVESVVETVVYLIIVGGVFWLLLWLISYVGLPEPFAKVAKIVLMVVGVLILINILLGFAGHPIFTLR